MPEEKPAEKPSFPWWVILCLVGLDYFSSIAYLPSIAMAQVRSLTGVGSLTAEQARALAPVAALGVVLATLLAALPVYVYVVGKSPHGKGGVGLLERRASGWGWKLVILALLGFVAADFVLTRSLSTSDAAVHVLGNTYYQQHVSWLFRSWLPGLIPWPGLTEQLGVSIVLAVTAFGFYFFLVRQLTRGFLGLAVGVCLLYLAVNAALFAAAWGHLQAHWHLVEAWESNLRPAIGDIRAGSTTTLAFLGLLALVTFPPMAIGLSGFELTMASAPLVQGSPRDDPRSPWWRIFNTRLMMALAALIMCALVVASVFTVALLVPDEGLFAGDEVKHRALAYLAHGGVTRSGEPLASWMGPDFGTLYDVSTVMILCLAGASATVTLRDIVPDFLARFGMQPDWARQTRVILHLFNATILVTTIVFRASVADQLWAYSASVLALLFGAALAALLDARQSWQGTYFRWIAQAPFLLAAGLFFVMGLLITYQSPSGVVIALGFVAVVMVVASVSRWLRSTEPRFARLRFASKAAEEAWDRLRQLEAQVLVPQIAGSQCLTAKEAQIRASHRLGQEVPILFLEVEVGDPSEFAVEPVLDVAEEEGRTVLRVREATSVPHTIAAIALAFCEVGIPPEVHFTWSDESPLEANLNFVLLGQGNVPWMVHELVRRAVKDRSRRPRVVVG
jgi:hypothetical protein